MPGRDASASEYRYGFNGKEKDDEVSGNGNQYDYGFRIYNPRIAKFLSIDPLFKSYPWYTPYQFAGNNPILNIDLDGLEEQNYLIKVIMDYLFGPNGATNEEEIMESVRTKNIVQKRVEDLNKKIETVKKDAEIAGKITGDVVMIAGGVVAIAASGGAATPLVAGFLITSGTFSMAAGSTKLILDLAEKDELSDKVPSSFFDAIVGMPAEIIIGGDEGKIVRGVLNVSEGIITFEPESVEALYDAYDIGQELQELIENGEENSDETTKNKE